MDFDFVVLVFWTGVGVSTTTGWTGVCVSTTTCLTAFDFLPFLGITFVNSLASFKSSICTVSGIVSWITVSGVVFWITGSSTTSSTKPSLTSSGIVWTFGLTLKSVLGNPPKVSSGL